MKNGLFFLLSSLAFVPALFANDAQDDQRIIQYTITVYRDKKEYDADKWDRMLRDAQGAVSRGQTYEGTDLVDTIATNLKSIMTDGKGIHGEISVSISSDSCDDSCGCKGKRGDESGSSSSCDMSKCMEQCRKACESSGADFERCKDACKSACEGSCE